MCTFDHIDIFDLLETLQINSFVYIHVNIYVRAKYGTRNKDMCILQYLSTKSHHSTCASVDVTYSKHYDILQLLY